jgi:hypothetical protein
MFKKRKTELYKKNCMKHIYTWTPNLNKKELYIVTRRSKAGIVKSEETSIATQRLGKHIPAAMNTQATIE